MRKSSLIHLTLIALAAGLVTYGTARAADQQKGGDVFVDEGDGDFDSMPVPTSASSLKPSAAPAAAPAEQPKHDMHEAAAPAPVAVPEAAPVKEAPPAQADQDVVPDDVPDTAAAPVAAPPKDAPAAAPAPKEEAAAPAPIDPSPDLEAPAAPAPKAQAAEAPKHEKQHKTAAAATSGRLAKGYYAVTQSKCPMTRAPASDSEQMITVRASKKIWVEKVDANWVRAFNKAGEPGYIQTNCVEFTN